MLARSQVLRGGYKFIPASAFEMRKKALSDTFEPIIKASEDAGPQVQMPAQDPFVMVNMMKQQAGMFVPQMLMMGWISYFFSGFVVARLPFGVAENFRPMLQRGVALQSLDVAYVSSLSWYFLVLFGLRGLFALVLGSNNATDQAAMMRKQMGGGGMQQPDPAKQIKQENTELGIIDHELVVTAAERRLAVQAQL
jgi:ER membrane protein complex subunit 3